MKTRVYRFPCGNLRFQTDSNTILRAVEQRAGHLAISGSHGSRADFKFTLRYRDPDRKYPLPPDSRLIYTNEILPGVSLEYFASEKGRVFRIAGCDVVIADYERNVAEGCSSLSCQAWERGYVFNCLIMPPLIEWFSRNRMYAFHGGVVSREEDGVLLFAAGGNGKTTAVTALAFGGFHFLTDDMGLLVERGRELLVMGIPEPISLCPDATELFERLAPLKAEFDGPGKKAFSVQRLLGVSTKPSSIPRVILFPEVHPGEETSLVPVHRGEAVELLLPNCLFLTGMIEGRDRFLAFLRLVEETVPMRLVLGKHLERLPAMVREALSA